MTRSSLIKICITLLLLFLLLPLQAQLPKIVFAPQWLPQAQFAGYYTALDKGFYKEAGLDVEIIHPSASVQATALLAEGKADVISLFMVTGIAMKDQGLDLVNIGQLSQHSAILMVTKKTSGIDKPELLDGKKIGIWKSGFDELPKAMIEEKKLKVEWVPLLSSVNLFTMNGIDAMTVMWYNEYDQIVNCGINEDELNTLFLSKLGYDIPEDGLYCLKSTAVQKKEELGKFIKATLKGWEYVARDREFALNAVIKRMKEAHIASNRAHQEWMLDKVLEMIAPGDKAVTPGELLEKDYREASDLLLRSGRISAKINYPDFYFPVKE
jgi:NitT/TauT family transport system substrate-binding protein